MAHHPTPLKFLAPGWYAVPMGLSGLALAWHRAAPLMGDMAGALAMVLGALAALVFAVLLGFTAMRAQRHPEAWLDDRRHPVRHAFIATLPVAAVLLATVAVAVTGPSALADALWWVGTSSLLGVTLWVLARWFQPAAQGGVSWAAITPALFIPVVGNVLAPLAGVPLGHASWAAAQFGIGLVLWPLVLGLLLTRWLVQGPLPERLLPTLFILIAPPAVIGNALLSLGAPVLLAWGAWGMAAFTLLWVGSQARRIIALPFGMTHWALLFPLAALTALTLRLAEPGGLLAVLGPLLLALSSLLALVLTLGTVRGLREGHLLAPEPVAIINVAASPEAK
jgi:tellurite resistance protein